MSCSLVHRKVCVEECLWVLAFYKKTMFFYREVDVQYCTFSYYLYILTGGVDVDNYSGVILRLFATLVLVHANPIPWFIVTATALMSNWGRANRWAVLVRAPADCGPEEMTVRIEGVLGGER